LFDAVSALAGVCIEARYEGQPAVELEQVIEHDSSSGYTLNLVQAGQGYDLDWRDLAARAVEYRLRGAGAGVIASRFHAGLARAFAEVCAALSGEKGIKQVVLSGGCFMNMFLLSRLTGELNGRGLTVFTHTRVPCNDGGIALGQAVIADARFKKQ
jgi:hydrogenase maturation protein HypF